MQITSVHATYFATELTKRSPSDSIQKIVTSLMDAQVDLNPHQVEAALFAFRSPLSTGALLADEVGLGKTIEAGLVISQKWAERKRKILVIAPANLRKQWSQELSDKFHLPSLILETKSFNQELQNQRFNPFDQNSIIVICSYQFARKQEHYIRGVDWHLVVIDEAHRLRNVYKPSSKIANAIKNAVDGRPKILLTATPLQNSLQELYGLVSIIDNYTFGDLQSFRTQYLRSQEESVFAELRRRLQPVCIRTLRKQVLEYVRYTNRVPLTQEFFPTAEEQKLYDLVSDYLQGEKLYALPKSQRALMTLILRRLLASSTFAISHTLEKLAVKLEQVVDEQSAVNEQFQEDIADNFEEYNELLDEWEEEDESPEERLYTAEEIAEIKSESAQLREFFLLAQSIKKNSKGEVLLTALKKGLEESGKRGASRKAIIFTESTRTQLYLYQLLQETEFRDKIVLFNGSNNSPEVRVIYNKWLELNKGTDRVSGSVTADIRAAIIDKFRNDAEIMIATEAAAEGVNLQFCSLIVNYDLPWNPQRIEQRIGRCHRYGQKYDVVVVNFLNKANAADERVYELLSEKFRLFEGVFGASDEILGVVESGVDFEKRIVEIYQRCRTEEEINRAFDELQKTFEDQIDRNMGITRQRLLENFDQEVIEKLRISMSTSREYISRYETWLWHLTRYCLNDFASFNESGYSFHLAQNPYPQEPILLGSYIMGRNGEDANTYRIGHPLARRIIEQCKNFENNNLEVTFNLSGHIPRIASLERFAGKSGTLVCRLFTIESMETEDHIIMAGFTGDGLMLEKEHCQRLFMLDGEAQPLVLKSESVYLASLMQELTRQEQEILQMHAERNGRFFDDELEKLDKWADDLKASIEFALKDLDREIKLKKTEAKRLFKLEDKLTAQREIKELESRRNELRRNLFTAQDDVDAKKEELITRIEAKMKKFISSNEIIKVFFTIN